MKPALAILAVVLLLGGCGGTSSAKDPFVGTWQSRSPDMTLIIGKVADGYRVTGTVSSGPSVAGAVLQGPSSSFILSRHGDELTGTFGGTFPVSVVVAYLPATGHLTIKSSAGYFGELSKVSGSTASPRPKPVRPATVGPGWVKMVSFNGRLPASKNGVPARGFSYGFRIEGGTLRAVGVVTSNVSGVVGLSLWVQKETTGGHWVDAQDGMMVPRNHDFPSGSSMAFDWATTTILRPGVYRVAILGGGEDNGVYIAETFSASVYLMK